MKRFLFANLFLLFSSEMLSQEIYQNDLVKFKMRIPARWHYSGTEETKKNIKDIGIADEKLKQAAANRNGIISQEAYCKYAQDSIVGFAPTIKITVMLNPAKNPDHFGRVMYNSAERLKATLKGFEFIDNLDTIKVSNHDCIYYSCKFTISTASVDKFPVRAKAYSIARGQYFIQLTLMDNKGTEDCSDIFSQVIKSISIDD